MTQAHNACDDSLHVAVGIVRDAAGNVLIQQREDGQFAGMWEYPGGKVEEGEAAQDALRRELAEELGVTVDASRPLIRIRHRYKDRSVLLDAWDVLAYNGTATGAEGQITRWVSPAGLRHEDMLPADGPITTAVNLPDRYLSFPLRAADGQLFEALEQALAAGIRLVGLIAPTQSDTATRSVWMQEVHRRCQRAGARVLVVSSLDAALALLASGDADGIQVGIGELVGAVRRPVGDEQCLAVATSDANGLAAAVDTAADFAVLGPNDGTNVSTKDWRDAALAIEGCNLPVYVSGVQDSAQINAARQAGAQGIASTAL